MTTECNMAGALMEAWREFTISPQQFRQIAAEFAVTLEQVKAATEADFTVSPNLKTMPV